MILPILNELKTISSTKLKQARVLAEFDNELFRRVAYLTLSPRVKFYIRKIPQYSTPDTASMTLSDAINELVVLQTRQKTGNSAIEHLQHLLSSLSKDDARVLELIIQKDLKCGVSTSIVNKCFPKLVEETPYMGAVAYDKKKVANLFKNEKVGVVSNEKMDGRYANCIVTSDDVILESRNGEETLLGNSFSFIKHYFENIVLNSELIIEGISRYESNGIIASLVSINTKKNKSEDVTKELAAFVEEHNMTFNDAQSKVVMVCWDVITLDEYNNAYSETPYHQRIKILENIISRINSPRLKLVDSKLVKSPEEARLHFQQMLMEGKEGTILKGLSGTWKDGKPSWQIKFKMEFALDLIMVSFNYGTLDTKNENVISSINVQSEDGLLIASVGGISEDKMKYITENQEMLRGKILQTLCSGLSITDNGYGLLHPRYDEIRFDKDAANTLIECIDIENSVKQISDEMLCGIIKQPENV